MCKDNPIANRVLTINKRTNMLCCAANCRLRPCLNTRCTHRKKRI